MGYDPTTPAFRRGPYYVLHAYDRYGVKVRVVNDTQLGDTEASIRAALRCRPRIIHVQPGEASKR